jgi:hypothetical protein
MTSILNQEFCALHEFKKNSQQMGDWVIGKYLETLTCRSYPTEVLEKIHDYNNYNKVLVSEVLISNKNIDASATINYESTGIERMNDVVDITEKPKVNQLLSIIHTLSNY